MAGQTEKQVTLEFIGKQLEKVLAEMRELRRDVTNSVTLATKNLDFSRRVERRLGELDERVTQTNRRIDEIKDDLEVMFKAEIMGQLNHFETRLSRMLGDEHE
jgi:hypothetical protein